MDAPPIRFNAAGNAAAAQHLRDSQPQAMQAIRTYFSRPQRGNRWLAMMLEVGPPVRFETHRASSRMREFEASTVIISRDPQGRLHMVEAGPNTPPLFHVAKPTHTRQAELAVYLDAAGGLDWAAGRAPTLDALLATLARTLAAQNVLILNVIALRLAVGADFVYAGMSTARNRHRATVEGAAGQVIAARMGLPVLNKLYRPGGLGYERVRERATKGMGGRKKRKAPAS